MKDLLIIPGVGYTVDWIKFLTGSWEKKYGIKTHVLSFEWDGDPDDAPEILSRTGRYLDELISQNRHVSIMGISAGGSAAVNLYIPRKDKIEKVVTVCGRVRDPKVKHTWNHGPGSLNIYIESTKLSEQNLKKLTSRDKKKILTVVPFYDEIVPVRTMIIPGAVNKRITVIQHWVSIFLALTLYSKTIADFIKN